VPTPWDALLIGVEAGLATLERNSSLYKQQIEHCRRHVQKRKLQCAFSEWCPRHRCFKHSALTVEGLTAVGLYTSNNIYRDLNSAMRDGVPLCPRAQAQFVTQWGAFVKLLLQTLRALPDFRGQVYRGVSLPTSTIASFRPMQTLHWQSLSSATVELGVAESFTFCGGVSAEWVRLVLLAAVISYTAAWCVWFRQGVFQHLLCDPHRQYHLLACTVFVLLIVVTCVYRRRWRIPAHQGVVFRMQTAHAKNIAGFSHFPHEQEMLLLPGTIVHIRTVQSPTTASCMMIEAEC
jgi:hypothetical protein